MRTPLLIAIALLIGCPETGDEGLQPGADDLIAVLHAEPEVALVGESIRFDASESVDRQGVAAGFSDTAIEEFRFDFGDDGFFVTDTHWITHTYEEAGVYTAVLTVTEGSETAEATVEVTVRHPPPGVLGLDVSGDEKAVIGEWVTLDGRGFREDNQPEVTFDSVEATQIAFVNEFQWSIQVPPGTPSGLTEVQIDFPDENEGDAELETWVARYALATDAFRGRANIVEFGEFDSAWPASQTLELDNAAVVRMSADGSFALIGDARFQVALAPTIALVDMTSDWNPSVTAVLEGLGDGPLHDIALARDVPLAVVTDLTGFTVLDLSDPADPVAVGDRETYQFADMAPTAVALSPDGTRMAVLSTFTDQLRFYSITPTGPIYEADAVAVGEGTQGMVVHPTEDLLYVLGGGGFGSIPPDLNGGNTSVTVLDWSGQPAVNVHAGPLLVPEVAVPIDIAVGPSGKAWITTLDQNFGTIGGAFSDLAADPVNLGAWQDLIESLGNLGFGAAIGVDGLLDGTPVADAGTFSPFGFQGGIGVRYDERVAVSTVIGLGTTVEIFNGDELLHLSLDIDYGVAITNLVSGDVQVHPMFTAPVVSYIDFVLNYDVAPLLELLLPPYAFGDVAIQP